MLAAGTVTTGSASRSGAPAVPRSSASRCAARCSWYASHVAMPPPTCTASARASPAPWRARYSLAPSLTAPRPQVFQTPPPPKKGMSIRCLQKPWGSSKTLGSLRNLGVPPKPWGPSTWARGRRKPGGAGARVASPWSEDAARQVGAAPAAGRRRARAPRAASRAEIYIHKFSHFRQKFRNGFGGARTTSTQRAVEC